MPFNTINNHSENSLYTIFPNQTFVDCNILQFGWEACRPLKSFGPATRNHFLFHYIISGKGELTSTNSNGIINIYKLQAGDGFLITPYQHNTYIADQYTPWEYTWVEFDGLKPQELLNLAGLDFDHPIYKSNNPEMQQVVKEELIYMAHHGSESALNLMAHLYLFLDALLKSSANRKTPTEGNLKEFYARQAIEFIENNYFNDITIKDIAYFCNLNSSYFGKLFKEVVKTTPQDFLIQFRMSKACEYLKSTNMPISGISAQVGYPSSLHFSRTFKSVYGISPREWRHQNLHK